MNHSLRGQYNIILSSALSLVCGLAGGLFSSYFFNQPALAVKNNVPAIIRAGSFELVDKTGRPVGGLYSMNDGPVFLLTNNKGQALNAQISSEYTGFYVRNKNKPIIRLEMVNNNTDSSLQFNFNEKNRVNLDANQNRSIIELKGPVTDRWYERANH